MMLRRRFLPRNLQDSFVTAFVTVIIPVVYWFELFIVLPKFYQQWSLWYNFHFLTGTFILLNVSTNFLAVIMFDTSISGLVLRVTYDKDWRFCSVCESLAPPRSWHCNVCRTCILKRDHHCIFTGCCVGHANLRYFIMFVFYIFIATLYAMYYNIYFVSEFLRFSWMMLVQFVFPLAMVFVQTSWNQLYVFIVCIVFAGCLFTGFLLYFHMNLILKGQTTPEQKLKVHLYQYGRIENLKIALGERWYLVWISPFITSELTHDGINWKQVETLKTK